MGKARFNGLDLDGCLDEITSASPVSQHGAETPGGHWFSFLVLSLSCTEAAYHSICAIFHNKIALMYIEDVDYF